MNDSPAGKKPLAVYAVVERKEGAKPFWMRIGSAYTNRDASLTLVLDAFPTGTNRLQVREQKEWEGRPQGANGQNEAHP